MKYLLAAFALLLVQCLFAQTFTYPVFKPAGKTVNDYIPARWMLKDSAGGDLNSDGNRDMALVIEYKDTITEMRPDTTENTGSPRILLILFKNAATGNYDMVLQNNTFIMRYGEGGMDPEPYDKMSITGKVLDISFEFVRGNLNYKFRFQQNDFYLIGASNMGISGVSEDHWDVNFSTKKAKHSWGKPNSDKLKEKWMVLPVGAVKKLKDMEMVYRWQALPDVSF
jgi:hypothetical protein